MRVAAISHSAVVDAYREKFRLLSRRRSWDLHLILPHAWPEGGQDIAAPAGPAEGRLSLHVLRAQFRGSVGFLRYVGLRRLLLGLKPDLVYIEEEPYSLATVQALRAADHLGVPAVAYSWENLERRYRFPLQVALRWVLPRLAGLVAGSAQTKQLFRAKLASDARCLVQPQYGVNTDRFRPHRRAGKAPLTVGYFGRLAPEKGVADLLRAAALARWPLLIGGRGPEEDSLKALARSLRLEAHFEGFVPYARRQVFFRRLDALVLPSRTTPQWAEQFGRVLAEAMACGVPCVGSQSGAIPAVLGKAGLTFPEGDVQSLAARLERLALSPALRRRLAREGRRRAVARFDEVALVLELGAWLENLAGLAARQAAA